MVSVVYKTSEGVSTAVEATDVQELKSIVAARQGCDAGCLNVISSGRVLSDSAVFVGAEEVAVVAEVDGGAKGKKKKKQYTTPKHVAHKRKHVKLAVLKYYSIDGDKIVRTRLPCVSGTCSKGVNMAVHKDRNHCGKCGLTLIKQKDNSE